METPLITRSAEESKNFLRRFLFVHIYAPCGGAEIMNAGEIIYGKRTRNPLKIMPLHAIIIMYNIYRKGVDNGDKAADTYLPRRA